MYTVDLYLRVRLACHVDGLSQREAASRFGIARETVRKMLRHSEPPGYRRRQPPKRPKLAVPPINSVRRRNPDLSGWCPIAFVTRTRSCFTAFSRSFAIAPCDSSRSSRLVINWTSFGAPAKPVAGTLKIPGFLRRTEFIEGTPRRRAPRQNASRICCATHAIVGFDHVIGGAKLESTRAERKLVHTNVMRYAVLRGTR